MVSFLIETNKLEQTQCTALCPGTCSLAWLGPVLQLAQTGCEVPGVAEELLGTSCLPNACLVLCHLTDIIYWSHSLGQRVRTCMFLPGAGKRINPHISKSVSIRTICSLTMPSEPKHRSLWVCVPHPGRKQGFF